MFDTLVNVLAKVLLDEEMTVSLIVVLFLALLIFVARWRRAVNERKQCQAAIDTIHNLAKEKHGRV